MSLATGALPTTAVGTLVHAEPSPPLGAPPRALPHAGDTRLSQVPLRPDVASVRLSSAGTVQILFTDGTAAEVPPDLTVTSAKDIPSCTGRLLRSPILTVAEPPLCRRRRRLPLPIHSQPPLLTSFSACSPLCALSYTLGSFVFCRVH